MMFWVCLMLFQTADSEFQRHSHGKTFGHFRCLDYYSRLFLRGSLFDPFGYQHERKLERQLIRDYLDDIAEVEQTLVTHNLIQLKNLLNWPESIRGYGPVKLEGIERAMQERQVAKDKYLNQSKYDNAA